MFFFILWCINLTYALMRQSICYSVFLNSLAFNNNKPVFERVIWSDSDVNQDFNSLFSSFRHLFGEKCVIVVRSENVG